MLLYENEYYSNDLTALLEDAYDEVMINEGSILLFSEANVTNQKAIQVGNLQKLLIKNGVKTDDDFVKFAKKETFINIILSIIAGAGVGFATGAAAPISAVIGVGAFIAAVTRVMKRNKDLDEKKYDEFLRTLRSSRDDFEKKSKDSKYTPSEQRKFKKVVKTIQTNLDNM